MSTEEHWYVLEYMAPLILMSTNLRQPSPNPYTEPSNGSGYGGVFFSYER